MSAPEHLSAAPLDGDLAAQVLRLRWQCRRGMLELDLLLNRFLDEGYAALDAAGRVDFVRFLGFPDQILLDWLLEQSVPAEPAMAAMAGRVRAATRPA